VRLPTLAESTEPILRLIEEQLEENREKPLEPDTNPSPSSESDPEPDSNLNRDLETEQEAVSSSLAGSEADTEQDPLDSEAYKPQHVMESVLENVIETVLDPARYASDAADSAAKPESDSSEAGTGSASRPLLEEAEASARIADTLHAGSYVITLTDDQLTVGDDQEHEYFVFAVTDVGAAEPVSRVPSAADTDTDTLIGYVAVNRVTGELYYYLGDGVLEDYASFPLYDADAAWACRWVGTYQGPASMTLEVLQGTSEAFTYRFSDGTTGQAQLSSNTAKSTDPAISFLFADDTITVISEKLVGNYHLVPSTNEDA